MLDIVLISIMTIKFQFKKRLVYIFIIFNLLLHFFYNIEKGKTTFLEIISKRQMEKNNQYAISLYIHLIGIQISLIRLQILK